MPKSLSDLMDDSKQRISEHLNHPSVPDNEPSPPSGPDWKKISTGLGVLSVVLLVALVATQAPLRKTNGDLSANVKALQSKLAVIEDDNRQIVEKIQAERDSLKAAMDSSAKDSESLKFAVQKAELKLKSFEEEKVFLEDILIHKTKEIESLRSAAPAGPAVSGDAAEGLRQKESEIEKLSVRNKQLSKKLDDLYRVTSERLSAIGAARANALEETIFEARKKIDEVWNSVDLGTLTVEPKAPSAPREGTRQKSKNEGRILAINEEHGFVVVDLGKVDNIGSDTQFDVTRGREKLAVLSAMEIRDVMTACNILDVKKGAVLEVDDAVTVRK